MAKISVSIILEERVDVIARTVLAGNDSGELAEKLAAFSLNNNQWAEVLTLANEKINDGDWRAKHVVETF